MGWFSGRHEELLTLLAERQRVLEQALEGVLVEVHEIKTALVVRDPGNRLSADAYQGLRQAVMAGASARRMHLVQLAQMAEAVRSGADSAALRSLVEEWVMQAGLAQVEDPKNPALYEIVDGSGEALRVRQPAWVDTHNGSLIRRGTAERIPAPPRASIGVENKEAAGEDRSADESAHTPDEAHDSVMLDKPSDGVTPEAQGSASEASAPSEIPGAGTEAVDSPPASGETAADQSPPEGLTSSPEEVHGDRQRDEKDEA